MADGVDNRVQVSAARNTAKIGIRASDADRLATVLVLQDAMARGQLTPDEASDRMASAFAAVHRNDLDPLTADVTPAPRAADEPPGWRSLGRMAVEQARVSVHDTMTGGQGRTRIALALLLLVVLTLAVGVVMADFMVNAWGTTGPRDFHHH
jgi:Domain of unknown function (DUF1707)